MIKTNSEIGARETIVYEYRFLTTPEYIVVDEDWKLFDVFLKNLDNGYPIFVTVFRKKVV